jgi:Nuclease-related domain
MARMFPDQFPGEYVAQNPEFEVFQTLRALPDSYSVFYSKKFKGGKKSKEECEVDFLVFDGKKTLLCMEVKGGLIEYRGDEDAWYQNGRNLSPSSDRQASATKAAVLEFLGVAASDINVGWLPCFPNCSLPANFQPPAGLPRPVILDQSKLLNIEEG